MKMELFHCEYVRHVQYETGYLHDHWILWNKNIKFIIHFSLVSFGKYLQKTNVRDLFTEHSVL